MYSHGATDSMYSRDVCVCDVCMYSRDHVCLSACTVIMPLTSCAVMMPYKQQVGCCISAEAQVAVANLAEAQVQCSVMQDTSAVCASGE